MLEEQREAPSPSCARFHRHDRLFSLVSAARSFALYCSYEVEQLGSIRTLCRTLRDCDVPRTCWAKAANGATLQITVLPASMQQEIDPEVHHINCSWVLQLWYRRNADEDVSGQALPRGARFDSLLFTLWSSSTREVIEKGAGFVSLATKPPLTPFAMFRKQILKKLNRLP